MGRISNMNVRHVFKAVVENRFQTRFTKKHWNYLYFGVLVKLSFLGRISKNPSRRLLYQDRFT